MPAEISSLRRQPPGQGFAATLAVKMTDPSLIAASSDGTPDSNGNLAVLLAVDESAGAGRQTPTAIIRVLLSTWATMSPMLRPN